MAASAGVFIPTRLPSFSYADGLQGMQNALDPFPDVEFLAVEVLEFTGFPPRLCKLLFQLADAGRKVFVFRQERANPFFYECESVIEVLQVVLSSSPACIAFVVMIHPLSRWSGHGFCA